MEMEILCKSGNSTYTALLHNWLYGGFALSPPGGVLGYKRDGGGPTEPNILHPKKYMDLILCTQKNTRLEIIRFMLSDLAGTLA